MLPCMSKERKPTSFFCESTHKKAVDRLGQYLQTPEEKILRDHQVDVMQSLYEFLSSGRTAGYISLPPGSGKTVIATELARALGLKTVILSPTRPILTQTHKTFEKYSPNIQVANYYSKEKNLNGDVINTTYKSFLTLIN